MTGMEHAIELVANALHGDQCPDDPDPGDRCNCGADDFHRQAEIALDTLREAGLLAHAPLREESPVDEPEQWRCPGCNSDQWVRASLTRGFTVITQCVPCGRYVNCPPPDRAEGESWYDAEPDAMPDAGWEPIEPVNRAKDTGRVTKR